MKRPEQCPKAPGPPPKKGARLRRTLVTTTTTAKLAATTVLPTTARALKAPATTRKRFNSVDHVQTIAPTPCSKDELTKQTTTDHNASHDDVTTTDDSEPTGQNVHRTLAACGRRRGRLQATKKLPAPSRRSTLLEKAVQTPTGINCRKEVCRCIRLRDQENVPLTGDAEVDEALMTHLHGLFLAKA